MNQKRRAPSTKADSSATGPRTTTRPSFTAARQRVGDAEEAERQADRALAQAREAVREARAQVKALEAEAAEEYVSP